MSFLHCFRLALYVYEYLLHVGAQKAAQTFLNEVNIALIIIWSVSHSFIQKIFTFGQISQIEIEID